MKTSIKKAFSKGDKVIGIFSDHLDDMFADKLETELILINQNEELLILFCENDGEYEFKDEYKDLSIEQICEGDYSNSEEIEDAFVLLYKTSNGYETSFGVSVDIFPK